MSEEKLKTVGGFFELIRLPEYNHQLERLSRREPDLHALVVEEVRGAIDNRQLKPIPGLGGWIKVRIPAPTLRKGKSGGFRAIFLYLNMDGKVFLQTIYLKSEKEDLTPVEKKGLAKFAASLKKEARDSRK